MEEDTGALECLILFYIDMKHVLKTKLLDEKVFFDKMFEHCRKNGYHSYGDDEIKNTWKKLVSKYLLLKANGSVEEREKWLYFEVLDSCYEESDFHSGVRQKFSEDMFWFLIECFWKRKALMKTQKRIYIINEIHKEFLQCGYSHVSKHDVESQWRYLHMTYGKVKDDPERLKKLPYLNAIRSFGEGDDHLIDMVFTKELTETLIDLFTKRKIGCIIHGYYSDQVLSHIQSKFKDMGFNFSHEAIKEKWKALTTIYKFILSRGGDKTAWIYFDAMKNHFKSDLILSKKDADKQSSGKRRLLKSRSKSVCVEDENMYWDDVPSSSETAPERDEKISATKKAPVKRPLESPDRSSSPKKLKSRGRPRESVDKKSKSVISESRIIGNRSDRCLRPRSKSVSARIYNEISEEDDSDFKFENASKKKKATPKKSVENIKSSNFDKVQTRSMRNSNALENLEKSHSSHTSDDAVPDDGKIFKKEPENEERTVSTSTTSIRNEVHVININQSDIEKENGTVTINLPSITKRVSSDELLPLKKRLKLDVNARATEGNLSVPVIQIGKQLDTSASIYLTDEEVTDIVKQIENENGEANQEVTSCSGPEGVKDCQGDTSSVEEEEKALLMLVIKVNEPKKTKDEGKPERPEDCDKDAERLVEDFNKPQVSSFADLDKLAGVKDVASIQTKTKGSNNKKNPTRDDCETIMSVADSTMPNTSCNSALFPKEIRPDAMNRKNSNDNVPCTAEEDSEVQTSDVSFRPALPRTEITPLQTETLSETDTVKQQGAGTYHLSSKVLEKLKQIISPSGVDDSCEGKPSTDSPKPSGINSNVPRKQMLPGFKFLSQLIKPPTTENPEEGDKRASNGEPVDDGCLMPPRSLTENWEFAGIDRSRFESATKRKEQFESDSIFSEGDDGLKDNLLATVIDFHEQNNKEFLEIKNLMRQNNLLQRETNRLLRLFLEGL